MEVYLLWHISHQNEAGPDDSVLHIDGEDVYLDEQDGDDVKLLGAYSSEAKAEARIERARLLPGFAAEPDCFVIAANTVDEDAWTSGFVRVYPSDEP